MPEENRVFDVTKPSEVAPPATSKPVIVSHQPSGGDPMVKDADQTEAEPIQVKVLGGAGDTETKDPTSPPTPEDTVPPPDAAAIFSEPPDETPAAPPEELPAPPAEPAAEADITPQEQPGEPTAAPAAPTDDMPAAPPHQPHIEELHLAEGHSKRGWWKPALLVLIILLAGAYLAIDAGLVRGYSHLPFHFFKQKQPAAQSSSSSGQASTNNQSSTAAPALPAGFKSYQLTGTNLTFAAPATWGAPTSTTEGGYTKRGTGQQSDGTHAYLVSFAGSKDIQLAVTSAKYLPPARGTQYYDYLQWCTGTNDGLYYQSMLRFTASAGIDTPSTITCDQGPMNGVTKLDAQTIEQAKATDAAGKVIGDVYTKDLSDSDLVVIRVKDAAMTNGDAIKQLLGTIQFTASP